MIFDVTPFVRHQTSDININLNWHQSPLLTFQIVTVTDTFLYWIVWPLVIHCFIILRSIHYLRTVDITFHMQNNLIYKNLHVQSHFLSRQVETMPGLARQALLEFLFVLKTKESVAEDFLVNTATVFSYLWSLLLSWNKRLCSSNRTLLPFFVNTTTMFLICDL